MKKKTLRNIETIRTIFFWLVGLAAIWFAEDIKIKFLGLYIMIIEVLYK